MRTTEVSFAQPGLLDVLVTTTEAARALDVSRATLNRWIEDGHARPDHKKPGARGPYMFTGSEILRLARTPRPRKPYTRRAA